MKRGFRFGGKRELLASGLLWSGAAFLLSQLPARDSLLVLNYHRIGNPEEDLFDPGVFSATAEEFSDQIAYLKRRVSPVTLEEALAFAAGTLKVPAEELPERIEALQAEVARWQGKLAWPDHAEKNVWNEAMAKMSVRQRDLQDERLVPAQPLAGCLDIGVAAGAVDLLIRLAQARQVGQRARSQHTVHGNLQWQRRQQRYQRGKQVEQTDSSQMRPARARHFHDFSK